MSHRHHDDDDDRDEDERDDEEEDSGDEESGDEHLTEEEREELEAERIEAQRSYWAVSRSRSASLLFILPLLLIYELGVMGMDVNAIAAIVKTPLTWLRRNPVEFFGADLMLLINGAMIVLVMFALWHLGRLGALRVGLFLGVVVESGIYALLIGPLALMPITGQFRFAGFDPNFSHFVQKVVLSAGAGVYEEFVFRFIILGLLYYVLYRGFEMSKVWSGGMALLLSSAVFSLIHFFSPGETVSLAAFNYRLIAGAVLGIIFLTRGLGIAVWTHALYDVYVLCCTPG